MTRRNETVSEMNTRLRWELIALMHWDERIGAAVRAAEAEYIAAGSPPIPLTEYNYREKFLKENA